MGLERFRNRFPAHPKCSKRMPPPSCAEQCTVAAGMRRRQRRKSPEARKGGQGRHVTASLGCPSFSLSSIRTLAHEDASNMTHTASARH